MQFNINTKYKNLPNVVLAGRPNVGKSTLFNRLLRQRRAITEPTPGVTRDAVSAATFILEHPVRLIDTGGYRLALSKEENNEAELLRLVQERTMQTLDAADLIVLLLEPGEITAEDEELIGAVRKYADHVIVAVNKTEGGRREAESYNILQYGFNNILFISAEHGDNIKDLENEIIKGLDFSNIKVDNSNSDDDDVIRIVLAGKPNTGKSTLSNRLTGSNASIVSEVAGTTRDVIEGTFMWKGKAFEVLDTAGIRRKAKVKESIEYYSVNRAIKSMDNCDVVIILIDAIEGFSEQDKKITAAACEKGRGVIFALNKWDAMPQVKNTFNAVSDKIRFFFGQMEYAPIIAISALDGEGITELLNTTIKMYKQLHNTIDTSAFNKALDNWKALNPEPYGPSTRFKVKYGLQISVNPVKFALFVSRPNAVSNAYITYIKNKIRSDLDYSMIPVEVEVRPSRNTTERVYHTKMDGRR
jgi:GTP-binding protein